MTTNNSLEYTIYTFDDHQNKTRKANWQKHSTSTDMHKAVQEAQGLFDTNQFCKVEVKKKYFDPKNERTVDMSIKVLERKPKRTINVATILIGGLVLAIIAFLATYYLLAK